jgi:hypothetical protein
VAAYLTPERAVRAMVALRDYARIRETVAGTRAPKAIPA